MQQPTVRQRLGVIVAMLVLSVPALAAVDVQILGEPADISPTPRVNDDGVLLGAPAPIAGKLGCRFMRRDENTLLIVTPSDRRITITAGSSSFTLNDIELAMPHAAFIAGDEFICPIIPVLEAMNARVDWNVETETLAVGTRITAVEVRADEQGARVDVKTELHADGELLRMEDPERAYVDIRGATIDLEHERTYVNLGKVIRVRWGQFSTDPPVARIVMDLRNEADVRWEPDSNDLGGAMTIGQLDGDEPLIERHIPKITRIDTRVPDEDTTMVRVELSDPVETDIGVSRHPPQVALQFPDAAPAMPLAPMDVDGPFVRALQLEGAPQEPGATLKLSMEQLIHFEIDRSEDPAAVTLIFKRGKLADRRIVIDPGHGGKDSGARGQRLLEKDVNLDVAHQVAARLMRIGAQTVITRESDVYVGLYERPELANRLQADLFVSIHCNAMPTRNTGHGTETFYYHDRSMCLGAIMQDELLKTLGRKDRGLKWANFCVIRESHMPAVLVELMFLNDDEEEALMEKPGARTAAADAIVEGLRQYVEGTGTAPEDSEMGM